MESNEEKISRLRQMVEPQSKWDLSRNDKSAIRYALRLIDSKSQRVKKVDKGQSQQTATEEWSDLVSATNWEKGRLITKYLDAGGTAEQFTLCVGGMTTETVNNLHKVWTQFGADYLLFPFCRWTHFLAAINWDDARFWLERASMNHWTVREMRMQRFENASK